MKQSNSDDTEENMPEGVFGVLHVTRRIMRRNTFLNEKLGEY